MAVDTEGFQLLQLTNEDKHHFPKTAGFNLGNCQPCLNLQISLCPQASTVNSPPQ